ncbi:MAG: regulatory signaling modulator protein AmpE [Methylophilaceae bacterium]|nr:regulatory signaling modulator protein AmpE [Methylophilaceae bacterium]
MSFLVLLGALWLAHHWPPPSVLTVNHWHGALAQVLERSFNDGRAAHGVIAWSLGVMLPAAIVGAVLLMLHHWAAPLASLAGMGILYLLLDFRGFSTPAEEIASALRDSNAPAARSRLATWSGQPTEAFGAQEVACLAIETTLLRAHYGLFAPIFWFVLLGPAGAVLYRLSQSMDTTWGGTDTAFNQVARRIFYGLDWLPARFTAIGFAVVGDFEDALYCWRTQASAWPDRTKGIMLASGAGALGVHLGGTLPNRGILEFRPELGLGDAADADYLMSAVGLIWRVLVLMLVLLLLLTFSHWLGS